MSSTSKRDLPTDENGVRAKFDMALKVGVMGGAGMGVQTDYLDRAFELGQAIAAAGCVTITGACPGLSLAAARGPKDRGGFVVGISPGLSLDEHRLKYESPTAGHGILSRRTNHEH